MDNHQTNLIEIERRILITNELIKLKKHYLELKKLALASNPSDNNYIEYLEADFERCIEETIEIISKMN